MNVKKGKERFKKGRKSQLVGDNMLNILQRMALGLRRKDKERLRELDDNAKKVLDKYKKACEEEGKELERLRREGKIEPELERLLQQFDEEDAKYDGFKEGNVVDYNFLMKELVGVDFDKGEDEIILEMHPAREIVVKRNHKVKVPLKWALDRIYAINQIGIEAGIEDELKRFRKGAAEKIREALEGDKERLLPMDMAILLIAIDKKPNRFRGIGREVFLEMYGGECNIACNKLAKVIVDTIVEELKEEGKLVERKGLFSRLF